MHTRSFLRRFGDGLAMALVLSLFGFSIAMAEQPATTGNHYPDPELWHQLEGGAMVLDWMDMPSVARQLVPSIHTPSDVFVIGELVGLRYMTFDLPRHPVGTWYIGGLWEMDIALTEPGYFALEYRQRFDGCHWIKVCSIIAPNDSLRLGARVIAVAGIGTTDNEVWGYVVPLP